MEQLQIDTQRLDKINKGTNFLNLDNDYEKKRYFIEVMLEVSLSLENSREEIEVRNNLPISDGYYWRGGESVETFFKKLKEYVKLPLGKIILPAKSVIGSYQLGEIDEQIRNEEISFEDIKITIGELAEKRLRDKGIDFAKEVKKILNRQVATNKQEQIDAYVRLKDKIECLKNLLCKEKSYYGYNEKKDDTIKMPLSPDEYNAKLKEIEVELRVLEKEFGISGRPLEYVEVKEEKGFDEWFAENEVELRTDFAEQEQDEENEMTFDEYVEMCYSESE